MFSHLFRTVAILSVSCGLNCWLPSETGAQPTVDQLENEPAKVAAPSTTDGKTQPAPRKSGYLGLVGDDRREPGRGVRVLKVLAGGAAERAGVRVDDVIVAIGTRQIRTLDEMASVVSASAPGDKLQFELERNGALQQLEIELGQRPPSKPGDQRIGDLSNAAAGGADPTTAPRRRRLGIRTVAVTDDIRQLYDLPAARGALVAEVLVGSPAHAAGVPLDAVIVEADARPIATPEDLARAVAAVAAGKEIELRYFSRGELVSQKIRLDDEAGEEQLVARPPVPGAADGAADRARIEHLERRVRELETRIAELLERLDAKHPGNE